MGEAIVDLHRLLISKQTKLTVEEANIIESCKSKARTNFYGCSLLGCAAAWAATGKLGKLFRLSISTGAGVIFGVWMINRSLYSSADHILTLDGTILQKELANIMVVKYQNNPSLMKLISKHFYSERIYDDSTSNTPKVGWRYRSFFNDDVIIGNRTRDHESYNDSHNKSDSYDKSQGYSDSFEKSQGKSENITHSKRTTRERKQNFINPGPDIKSEADPLDCLFGYGAPVEEIFHPNTTNKPSATHHRSHRRHHRRRRMRDPDDLSNSVHAAAV